VNTFSPVVRLVVYVYGFIALCSAFGFIHPKLRSPAGRPIRQAINSWWPPALVGGAAVLGRSWLGVAVFGVVSLWALYEFLRLLPPDKRNGLVEFLAYLTVPVHYGFLISGVTPFAVPAAAWISGVLPLAWIFTGGPDGALRRLPLIQWGIALTVVALSYVARLLMLSPTIGPAGGAGLAALLLTTVMFNDAAQYVFGKLLGRHALAPVLSPKKTWEGFAGGFITASAVGAAACPLVTPFNAAKGAFIGAALSLAGVLGDLLVSGIKRDAGVKDTGAILPQHGGVLDRCDSLLLAAPLYFYGIQQWLR
jgi:phosphatidate cytidylyltransferase